VQLVDERGLARVRGSQHFESVAKVSRLVACSGVPKILKQSQRLVVALRILSGDQLLDLLPQRWLPSSELVEMLGPDYGRLALALGLLLRRLFCFEAAPFLGSVFRVAQQLRGCSPPGRRLAPVLIACALAPHALEELARERGVAPHHPYKQLVLLSGGELRDPSVRFRDLQFFRHDRRARYSGDGDKIGIDPQKLDETLERGAELSEAGRDRRFEIVVVEVAILQAEEPTELEHAQIAVGQLSPHRDQ
jgi:hypothetical protein